MLPLEPGFGGKWHKNLKASQCTEFCTPAGSYSCRCTGAPGRPCCSRCQAVATPAKPPPMTAYRRPPSSRFPPAARVRNDISKDNRRRQTPQSRVMHQQTPAAHMTSSCLGQQRASCLVGAQRCCSSLHERSAAVAGIYRDTCALWPRSAVESRCRARRQPCRACGRPPGLPETQGQDCMRSNSA